MKIAFLHHSFIIGSGIDSLIYQYAKRMTPQHEVEIFTFRSYYKLSTELWKVNVIDIPFGKTRLGSGVFAPFFIPWHSLRKRLEQFNVVVAQLYPANLIPVLPTKLNTKVVIIEWSTPRGVWNRWQERLYAQLAERASKIACKKADKVLVGSKFIQGHIKQKHGIESKVLCLDGLDFELLDKNKYHSEVKNNILYTGRISPHKNIHTLIKAFGLVKNEMNNATLTLVGSQTFPKYTKQLANLITELSLIGSVKMTGEVPWEELPQYYADCSIYCSPSLWEGYIRCEAFAFEKPIVVFDATSNTETVHNGIDGFVVKQQTSGALAQAIIVLLQSKIKRETMGQAGYKWARDNLDLNNITKELLDELAA